MDRKGSRGNSIEAWASNQALVVYQKGLMPKYVETLQGRLMCTLSPGGPPTTELPTKWTLTADLHRAKHFSDEIDARRFMKANRMDFRYFAFRRIPNIDPGELLVIPGPVRQG